MNRHEIGFYSISLAPPTANLATRGESARQDNLSREERIERDVLRFQKRRSGPLSGTQLDAILDDPKIAADIRFDVWFYVAMALAKPKLRTLPLNVLLARDIGGRRLLRKTGIRVPPPDERRAWEAWSKHGGQRPTANPGGRS
jgi:hypothetical protein